MYWKDEGYLLSKNNFNENSILIEAFTLNHGKYTGIVYGGSSRKQKRNFQSGNKILLNWKSKNQNRNGFFNVELLEPVAPFFFDDKKKIVCLLASTSILKILLPERQVNQKIYASFEKLLDSLKFDDWINVYIEWELSLIKELGFEDSIKKSYNNNIKKALSENKNLLLENFIIPNSLRFPLFRNILENYFN